MDDVEDARRSLPSWIFRRLYHNLPGQADGSARNAETVEDCIVRERKSLPPVPSVTYAAFVDMSGREADDSRLAIAHEAGGGQQEDEPKTLARNTVHTTLRTMLKAAIDDGVIMTNPVEKLGKRLPMGNKQTVDLLDAVVSEQSGSKMVAIGQKLFSANSYDTFEEIIKQDE